MKTLLSVLSGRPIPGRFSRAANITFLVVAVCTLFFSGTIASASDPVGVFAIVDKVVVEPATGTPERIQVWGTFSIAEGERGGNYRSPEKGYLYFKLPEKKPDVAQKEWADLKALAGKNEVVGFSHRYGIPPKVRQATEKPDKADEFRTGFGLIRMQSRAPSYAPVKALLESQVKTSDSKEAKS